MRIFRLLILLYPASFRADYGDELTTVFHTRMRNASMAGRLLLWIDTFIDILLTAGRTHFDILLSDVRFAWRTLRLSSGFTFTAVLVAALGIGATTAAYTIADYVLLRPLPYPDVDHLVLLWEDMSPGNYTQMEPSPANYRDWKKMSHSFTAMAAPPPVSWLDRSRRAKADRRRECHS